MTIDDIINSLLLAGVLLAIAFSTFLLIWACTKFALFLLDRWMIEYVFLRAENLWAGLPLSIAGLIAGFMTGISRTPAVSALVPAALTLIGGIALYLIGKERTQAIAVGLGIVAFSLNLVIGTSLGALSRERAISQQTSLEYLQRQADEEFLLRRYRQGYGLPPYPPSVPASLPNAE